jgi:hypothetical protein
MIRIPLYMFNTAGCKPEEKSFESEITDSDIDGDGYLNSEDCDPRNIYINPGAEEICDTVDNDCDGEIDELDECELTDINMISDITYLGRSVSVAGDVNGDGYDDFVIGAPGANDIEDEAENGQATIYYGGADDIYHIIEGTARLRAKDKGTQAGFSVAGPGDINRDGYDDIVVGAFQAGEADEGAAYVFYGPVTAQRLEEADVVLSGNQPGDYFGYNISGNDGYTLVGAPFTSDKATLAGTTYLIHGNLSDSGNIKDHATATIWGDTDLQVSGFYTAVGFRSTSDYIVSAPYDSSFTDRGGATYVLLGPATGGDLFLSEAEAIYYGENPHAYAGTLATNLDINNDGENDLFIGDAANNYVYVQTIISGDASLADSPIKISGPTDSWFGNSISSAGDTDGDGYDDVIIGAPGTESSTGNTYIFLGPLSPGTHTTDEAVLLPGTSAGDGMGNSVAGGGFDIDQDGLGDVLIGSPGADSTTLFFGKDF